jgi:hypothetical protein
MKAKYPGIRSFLCLAVTLDLDYLINNGIYVDDIQVIQFAITHIAMEERIKELQKFRKLSKWREENA